VHYACVFECPFDINLQVYLLSFKVSLILLSLQAAQSHSQAIDADEARIADNPKTSVVIVRVSTIDFSHIQTSD
jgi:hypothetical protein